MTHLPQQTINFANFKWVNIYKPEKQTLDAIAEAYHLNIFQITDSLEHGHLPKYEAQPNYNFLILRAFTSIIEENATNISDLSNKIAFFYNNNILITVHQREFDFLNHVPTDFKTSEELLLYLIHKMVKTYDYPSKIFDSKIEALEKIIFLKDDSKVSLENLYYLKTQTRIIKKLLLLFKNSADQIEVSISHKAALQDIKDKLVHLILGHDEVLDSANNLLNTYLSVNSQKSNDVMKLLTIFSAFFLPLTFIAGVYGMNFENMPELYWKWGYFLTLTTMIIVSIFIFWWFKRNKIL